MPLTLQDLRDGKVKIGRMTAVSYNGQLYRGKKEIDALLDAHKNDLTETEVKGDAATESDKRKG